MPDGNRRFGEQQRIPHVDAYLRGGRTLALCSDFFVTERRATQFIYHAMSAYTHRRDDPTLAAILTAGEITLNGLLAQDFFRSRNLAFRAVDHTGNLPPSIKIITDSLEKRNPTHPLGEIVVLLGYSLEKDMNTALETAPQNYQDLRNRLLFPHINLVLRNEEMRPSGGPVYAMDQAQMITLKKLNPDIQREDLEEAWQEFQRCQERHRKTSGLFK
jgi:undecaprenyl pyrophosphate synthase